MSVCTLPYLPLVIYGIWGTFQRGDARKRPASGMIALAATWHFAIRPLAFWAIIIATVSQVIRLVSKRPNPGVWRGWLAAAGIFAVLTVYTFISGPSAGSSPPLPSRFRAS